MPDLCTAVTQRGNEGPCATCGRIGVPEIHVRWGAGVPHRYLGPVLARCGHGKAMHRLYSSGEYLCHACAPAVDFSHEFTIEELPA